LNVSHFNSAAYILLTTIIFIAMTAPSATEIMDSKLSQFLEGDCMSAEEGKELLNSLVHPLDVLTLCLI
jgi:hypothetical protein